MDYYILIISFFIIAVIYASVGFGGGSSYLALMAVMSIQMNTMRPAALLCNIVVVTGGAYIYYKEKLINFKKISPFILSSVPLAFLGGYFPIREELFFQILGFTLVVAALFLWIQEEINEFRLSDKALLNTLLGGSIGFLSGLVGIGGGIFLSPILHFIRWDSARRISAVASVFILVNSISGLAGHLTRNSDIDWKFIIPLLLVVFIGGQIGSHLGATRLNFRYIKRMTAILILLAGINILKNHLRT